MGLEARLESILQGTSSPLPEFPDITEAESILTDLAAAFFRVSSPNGKIAECSSSYAEPDIQARYRVLLDQIPALVFMVYLDRGIGEAYVSPQIEAALGFSQKEWLEDPVRWYQQIHPEDKERWSAEAANMFLSGEPLRSSYRVLARDGRVLWFQCEARLVRRDDGRPWFVHGVGFDITALKQVEEALLAERNFVSALFETVGALVVVLDPRGGIVRFNRACEQTTGYTFQEVKGKQVWELFQIPGEFERFKAMFEQLRNGVLPVEYEACWRSRRGERRLISWSSTALKEPGGAVTHIIATGIDITERKRLEKAVLDIGAREQRRITQDLHDGLGQHLTGVAFMSKVLEQRLAESSTEGATEAAKIVALVNQAIQMTRELARGLLPVGPEGRNLISALDHWANEVSALFHVWCRFECPAPVPIDDDIVADHLYRVAREAVHNAVKHGRALNILIRLSATKDCGILTVRDDGSGFEAACRNQPGIGLRIMNYRAKMIGGSLDVQSSGEGTVVSCLFPIRDCGAEGSHGG